jgi:hypothetical protein
MRDRTDQISSATLKTSPRPKHRVLGALLAWALIPASGAWATDLFTGQPLRTLTGERSAPWERIEAHLDPHPGMIQETFIRGVHQQDHAGTGIIDGFDGVTTPPSSQFLLHVAPGWNKAIHPVPVLLVHGAGSNANQSFVGLRPDGARAMMRKLADSGFAVFAITFAHPHGDNFLQAEALADAVARVKQLTGAPQVDLVCHSKGGVVTRMYTSGLRRDWATDYRGDVRRVLFLASPQRGIDFSFRHPTSATIFFQMIGAAFSAPRDITPLTDPTGRKSIFGGAFTGQLQMLHDWSGVHPPQLIEADWLVSYTGGWGFLGHYPGIAEAIRRGESVIDRLERRGLDPKIEFALLFGSRRMFDQFTEHGVVHDAAPGEMDGPGDGLVFRESLRATTGLTRRGARCVDVTEQPINHAECVYAPSALTWVTEQLSR